jgi:hypothetical protein
MSTAAQRLRALATERFPMLTTAEEHLLSQVANGEEAHYENLDEAKNNLRQADTWGPERTIHAAVLRWLCVDRDAIQHIDPRGLSIHGARIDGTLDLRMVTIPFPLFLERCAIREPMKLGFAEVRVLEIVGSTSQSIDGTGMVVHGDLQLRDGFCAEGAVHLPNVTIDGDFDCTGGHFHNAGIALNVDGAKIGGDVRLLSKFRAEGQVTLTLAIIAGDLACEGTFQNGSGIALKADGATVKGSVLLRNEFRAEGFVHLDAIRIEGVLDCKGASFTGAKNGLLGEAMTVDKVFFWQEVTTNKTTIINLAGAKVGGLADDERSWGRLKQTASKFPFRWWGAHSVLSDRHQLDEPLGPHRTEEGTLDASEPRDANPKGYADSTRSASLPTDGNKIMTRFGLEGPHSKRWDLDGFIYGYILDGPVDATTRIRWLARQTPFSFRWCEDPTLVPLGYVQKDEERPRPFRPQPYQQLAKVLRERGQEADAKRVLIAKERERRKHGNLRCGAWLWSWLLYLTIGYGYRPWQALIWAVVWIAIGGSLFGWGYEKEIVIPTKAEAYDSDKKIRQEPAFYPAFNRWLYALDTFVPIINFGQKDYWAPQVACNRSGLLRDGGIRLCVWGIRALHLYRWLHIVAGWVLITLVVTGFTNLVRRE